MTRSRLLIVVGGVAVGLASLAVYGRAFRRAEALQGSGTVEARDVRVGSKVGGRVSAVCVREGDTVLADQVLVAFDDQELLAGLQEARANLEKMERGSRPEEVAEARAAVAQARADYQLHRNGSRREDIEAAHAEVDRTRVDAVHAERNFKRVSDPSVDDVFSKQQRDDTEAAWKMAVDAQRIAELKLAELERGYRPEEIASARARYRQAEATLRKLERGNRREEIGYAQAQLLDAEARYRERQVVAPSNATVEVLDVLPGDLVAPNTPIATLLERDQIYVRIYVPETKIGQVRIGQRAEVRVDSFPKEVFPAEVEEINQEAEFLPRNVETKEERVHEVFGVKLRIHDPSRRVRAGMAADVKLNP